jgi:hypothetical protein
MSPDDLRQELELTIVEYIKRALAAGAITEERGQQLSQIVLDTLKPGMNFEDLYSAIFMLDDSSPELSPIILPYVKNYEENVTKKATEMISSYIKVGKYDAAVKLGNDAASHTVKLQWQGSSSSS